jgi:NAD+ diphosphatase
MLYVHLAENHQREIPELIGFTARWAGGEIVADPREIADADWFLPGQLPRIPPRLSIARQLIDDFVRRHGGLEAT